MTGSLVNASPRTRSIRVRRRFGVPPARLFDAWFDPAVAGRWLFATASQPLAHVAIDARVGGAFRFAAREGPAALEYAGRYEEIRGAAGRPGTPAVSRVRVAMLPQGHGCALEVIHENLPDEAARYLKDRWTGMLYGLGVTLDALRPPATATGSPR